MEHNDSPTGQGISPESNKPVEGTSNQQTNMETLLKEQGMNLDFPQPGEVRMGSIASLSPTQIMVSIGAKSEGVINGNELEQIPADTRSSWQVGQEIPVFILASEDANGTVVLSYTRALEQKSWEAVEKLMESDESFEGHIDGFNKGGLIISIHGLRGFVPASQLSITRRMQITGDTPDQRYGSLIGEPIIVRVIEVDRTRRRLILSERAASSETRLSIKERVIDELKEGEVHMGRVTSLADFGAFVNIGGADGLVHLSEIAWERIQHPSEVLEVGQEIQVKVINVDREKKRIGLSIRALADDPWKKKVEKFKVGHLVEGVVTRLTKFGAFARIEGDVEGLIHISEISEKRIEHPKEILHEGDVVTLRVIRIDPDQRRIGLSLRKVDSGAFKDLDLKNIDLDGVNLELHQEITEDVDISLQVEESLPTNEETLPNNKEPSTKTKHPNRKKPNQESAPE